MLNPPTDALITSQQSVDFGTRLKIIREFNGLSQRELAKRAGVPHSSISMIEQGLNSPSINSLAKILGGIPMSIAHFFNCELSLLNEQIIRAADLNAKQRSISEHIVAQTIPLQNEATNTRFERVTFAVGSDSRELLQNEPLGFSGFIVSGAIELTLNAGVSLLSSGDAFSLGAAQTYRLRNVSDTEDCVILVCRA